MKYIGLVDDRDTQRRAFKLRLDTKLELSYPDWEIVDIKPFKDPKDYNSWINENEICLLIVDERLNEEPLEDGSTVDYYGSKLINELRTSYKDFPIFCVTSHTISDSLKAVVKDFNLTLSRATLESDIDNYLNSFIKFGESFYKENQKELSRVSELSEKVAIGSATANDKDELRSLQVNLMIPHISSGLGTQEAYIKELESNIEKIKRIQDDISKTPEKN